MSENSNKTGESEESEDSIERVHKEVIKRLNKLIASPGKPKEKKSIFGPVVLPAKLRPSIVERALKKSVISSTPFNKKTLKFFCSDSSCSPIIASTNDSFNRQNTATPEKINSLRDGNQSQKLRNKSPKNLQLINDENVQISNKSIQAKQNLRTKNGQRKSERNQQLNDINSDDEQNLATGKKNSLKNGDHLKNLTSKSLRNQLTSFENGEDFQKSKDGDHLKNLTSKSLRNQLTSFKDVEDIQKSKDGDHSRNLRNKSSFKDVEDIQKPKDGDHSRNLTSKSLRNQLTPFKDVEDIQKSKDGDHSRNLTSKSLRNQLTPFKDVVDIQKSKEGDHSRNFKNKSLRNELTPFKDVEDIQKSKDGDHSRNLTSKSLRNQLTPFKDVVDIQKSKEGDHSRNFKNKSLRNELTPFKDVEDIQKSKDGDHSRNLKNKSLRNELTPFKDVEHIQKSNDGDHLRNLTSKSLRNELTTFIDEKSKDGDHSKNLKNKSLRNQLTSFEDVQNCNKSNLMTSGKKDIPDRNETGKLTNNNNIVENNKICNKSIKDKQINITKTCSKIPVFSAAKQKQIEQKDNINKQDTCTYFHKRNTSRIDFKSISMQNNNKKSPKRRLTTFSSSTEPEIKKLRLNNLIDSLISRKSTTSQKVQHREVQTSLQTPISAIKTLARKPLFVKSDRESASSSISSALIQDVENASINIYDSIEEGSRVERFSSLYNYNVLENSQNHPWRYEFSDKIPTTSRNSNFCSGRHLLLDKQLKRRSIKQYRKNKIFGPTHSSDYSDYDDTSSENVSNKKTNLSSPHSSVESESSKNEESPPVQNNIEKWLTDVNRINQPEDFISQSVNTQSDINGCTRKTRYSLRIVVDDIFKKQHNVDKKNSEHTLIDDIHEVNEIPVQNTVIDDNEEENIRKTKKTTRGKRRPLKNNNTTDDKDVDAEIKKIVKSLFQHDQSNSVDTDQEELFKPLDKKTENTCNKDVEDEFTELNNTLVQNEPTNASDTAKKIFEKPKMTRRQKPGPLSKKKPKNAEDNKHDSNEEKNSLQVDVSNKPQVKINLRSSKKISHIDVSNPPEETTKQGRSTKISDIENVQDNGQDSNEEKNSLQVDVSNKPQVQINLRSSKKTSYIDVSNQPEETTKQRRSSTKIIDIENVEDNGHDSNETIKNSNEETNSLQLKVSRQIKEKAEKNKRGSKKTSNIGKKSLQADVSNEPQVKINLRSSKKTSYIENVEDNGHDSNETIKNSNEETNSLQLKVSSQIKEKAEKNKRGRSKKTSNIEKKSLQVEDVSKESTNRKTTSINNAEISKNGRDDGASMVTNGRPIRVRKPPPQSIYSCVIVSDRRLMSLNNNKNYYQTSRSYSIQKRKKSSVNNRISKLYANPGNISTIHEDPVNIDDNGKTTNKKSKKASTKKNVTLAKRKLLVDDETVENSSGFPRSNEHINVQEDSEVDNARPSISDTEFPENQEDNPGMCKSDLDSSTSTLKSPTNDFNSRTTRKNKISTQTKKTSKGKKNGALNKNINSIIDEYIEVPIENGVNKRLKYVEKNATFTECNDKLKYSNALDHLSGNSTVYLQLPPCSMKAVHVSKKHDLTFIVMQGNGIVNVRNKMSKIEKFSRVIVPMGSSYSIKNESTTDDLLLGCVRTPIC